MGILILMVASVSAQYTEAVKPPCSTGEPIEDIADTLRLISERFQENYSRIHTWRGTYHKTESTYTAAGGPENLIKKLAKDADQLEGSSSATMLRRFEGEFAVDFDGDRVFTSLTLSGPSSLTSNDTDKVVGMTDRMSERAVYTRDLYIRMDPDMEHDGTFLGLEDWRVTQGHVAFRDPIQIAAAEEFGMVPDPRKYMWIAGNMMTYVDYFAERSRFIASPQTPNNIKSLFSGTRMLTGDSVRYCLNLGDHQEFIIDGAAGHNVLRMRQVEPGDKTLISELEIEYLQDGELFMPKFVGLKLYHPGGKSLRGHSEWTLENSEINVPIDDSVFSYAQLGLVDGERVIDRVDNIGYIYSKGKLTEPKKFDINVFRLPRLDSPTTEDQSWRYYLIIVNLLVLAVVVVYFIVRRFTAR